MDHLQGLGFFKPLFRDDAVIHIWGPISSTKHLRDRLLLYMSPPLFPVRLRNLPSLVAIHDVTGGRFRAGEFEVCAELVCHPGPTLGYRIEEGGVSLAYPPNHEPALRGPALPGGAGVDSRGLRCWRGLRASCTTRSTRWRSTLDHAGWGTARLTTRWHWRGWRGWSGW